MELYLEWEARRLFPAAFFGATASEELKIDVGARLEKGVRAFGSLVRFGPYLAGGEFSLADFCAGTHLPLVSSATKIVFGRDVLEPVSGLKPYLKMLFAHPHFQAVNAARKADTEALIARNKA